AAIASARAMRWNARCVWLAFDVGARGRAVSGVGLVGPAVPETDDALIKILDDCDVPVFMGADTDVLQRVARAAVATAAQLVMRVTGDCPLFAPDVADALLEMWRRAAGQPQTRTL